MRHLNRKRLALVGGAVTTVGAGAALLAGATFGFFSSAGTASGNNTFTAGTVVVGLDGATSVTCAIGPMSPGDTQAKSGNVACKYDIKYTGNVNAYMAMDLAITGAGGTPVVAYTQTTAPPTAQGLYDGSATGLQFTITDNATVPVTYMSGVQYTTRESRAYDTYGIRRIRGDRQPPGDGRTDHHQSDEVHHRQLHPPHHGRQRLRPGVVSPRADDPRGAG